MSRHNTAAPGFSQAYDPFSGLSNSAGDDDGPLDFEDTYDGLGDQLEETNDAFNDDTFGDPASVGKDFDFFGQTANVSSAFEEEHLRFSRQAPAPAARAGPAPVPTATHAVQAHYHAPPAHYHEQAHRPARTGYEKYKEPEAVPDLHVDRSIWGMAPKQPPQQPQQPQPATATGRKVMSLEEVEAAMRAQSKPQSQPPPPQQDQRSAAESGDFLYAKIREPSHAQQQPHLPAQAPPAQSSHGHHPVQILQRPQSLTAKPQGQPAPGRSPQQPHHAAPTSQLHPTQILQNPNRVSEDAARMGIPAQPTHVSRGSATQIPTMPVPPQHAHLSEQEKAAYLEQEMRRAKRNHKIWLLSKDNGLMTPQDKNFITRIQLQQLVTATGIATEEGQEASLNDDFYYQVHASIRAGNRQNPSQPLHNFAQTYLYQTGSRQHGSRRHARAADNHVQRMEQQVQRAVEAAKNKPKNPQLVIAGSLGKISYSNAKTPKPLLNIKRADDAQRHAHGKKTPGTGQVDRKAILRNIESVYATLLKMEDHARHMPPPEETFQAQYQEWLATTKELNANLWSSLKVHDPIGATTLHPFIAFLSFHKGKKAIPRVFRHVTFEQRTTILTMIIFHLDQLDVVKGAQITDENMSLNAALRENIELFSLVVMPSLFQYFNETKLDIVEGVLDLINEKLNIDSIAKTRVGTSILTLILSRAELLKQAGDGTPEQWAKWESTFNTFFNIIAPSLADIFPGSVNSGEDIYVWQLLAAIGVSSSPDQQQRLVLTVKDRVMDTVGHAKTLPPAMAAQRLSNVNLFMQSIGLDVELLG
ncbi:related to topoisomerase II-associated protein [Cephalotrichum gorgonifer]|uniref:Related to topoisomerase II-associated protein n=1 Tax=Cephalotrichum gorgonifer TaxID=2041049 RepID=A0AAE8SSX4_9PEZI|nr:related to topoisomerase II-associated protein [Cephalotrichum gorgonifer]